MKRLLALAVAAALAAAAAPAAAQTPAPAGPELTVTGNATLERAPDRATATLEIVTNADDAARATGENAARYDRVRAGIVAAGVPAGAIRTVGYGLTNNPRPRQVEPRDGQMYGFIVERTLRVTIDDLTRLGPVIDAAVAAGASGANQIGFGFRDARAVQREALAAAYADAEAQARALAGAGRFQLAAVQHVGNVPVRFPYAQAEPAGFARAAAPMAPTVIPPGPVEVNATVTVTWRIAP